MFLENYHQEVAKRSNIKIAPKPLDLNQTKDLIQEIKSNKATQEHVDILTTRVPAGVDEAAYLKADFLAKIAKSEIQNQLISQVDAIKYLGHMQGGFNIKPLVELLDNEKYAKNAVDALSDTLLLYDAFLDIEKKYKANNKWAKQLLENYYNATWFVKKKPLDEVIKAVVFKVPGETNTDDLSPAQDAWSRPDIPLHAQAMLKNPRDGINGNALEILADLKKKNIPIVYCGDVVGTGSSRKSATNSILWHLGEDIPYIPNKRTKAIVIGNQIAPIFYNTLEDSGALPIQTNVTNLKMGDEIEIYPNLGQIKKDGKVISNFSLTNELKESVKAGGRIPLIIGRKLSLQAAKVLKKEKNPIFLYPKNQNDAKTAQTLAQKMLAKAAGLNSVLPNEYIEPKVTTVGSQDTTGPMTRDELKDLACLKFGSDLVMQSFCHTAAYPKEIDIKNQKTLPDFINNRGGVSLKAGDGIIHSWLNRMLLPDTVGTGGDSHTRFPLGISFPAGSGLVAFAATTGFMPQVVPESVLVRFKGKMQAGITLRDLVHAIAYYAKKQGLLTIEKKNKKNVFSGKILEIEGLEDLKVEQAFELSDASAERSAAACSINLNKEPIIEYITSNIALLKQLIKDGYSDKNTLANRIQKMQKWLKNPTLLRADKKAKYHTIIDIDLSEIDEPILCCPNDPDDVKKLSEVAHDKIDEVFIGSCMTNIGHFRAASKLLENFQDQLSTRLWVAPPTKMDNEKLKNEGHLNIFGKVGARMEMPGCSLCMGNQARVKDGASVVATATRNFPNRMGKDANVYLASAEVSVICAILGKIPNKQEYLEVMKKLSEHKDKIYTYLNFAA